MNISPQIWSVILLVFIFFGYKIWKRRWLYYYSFLLPGPFSVPFLGTLRLVFAGQKGVFQEACKLVDEYPNLWRFWLGSDMYIVTMRPQDAEYILPNCLQKETITLYKYMDESISSIMTTTYKKWKKHRKILNPTFNPKLLSSYFEVIVKSSKKLEKDLEGLCGQEIDVFPVVWQHISEAIFDALLQTDSDDFPLKISNFIPMVLEYEEILMQRVINVLYYFNFFWKMSSSYKKLTLVRSKAAQIMTKALNMHNSGPSENNFINNLKKGDYSLTPVEEEMMMMIAAGSETTALTTGAVLTVLSFHPDVQKKLYDEVKTVDEITIKDLDRLEYLDRVIKEMLRLSPPVPIISRHLDQTIEIDGQVFPAGTNVAFPISFLHKSPEFWTDPLKFDPDRFLPEEIEKRPRLAYLPFSFGPRNCIGLSLGVVILKIVLAKIVKKFEVLPGKIKSFDELEIVYHIVVKPKDGYKVTLKKRETI